MFSEAGAAIYTLGCGALLIQNIAGWLEAREVEYIIDIRSPPYAIERPELEPEHLSQYMRARGTRYLNLADQLGDRPRDISLFNKHRQIDYIKYRQRPLASKGLERIRAAFQMSCRVCILGREADPVRSHRARLIGQTLHDEGIHIRHLVHHGSKLMTQPELLHHLWWSQGDIDLGFLGTI